MAYEEDSERSLLYRITNMVAQLVRNVSSAGSAVDTDGNPVPVNRAHSFGYDDSGNLVTDTVSDGTNTWTRTYSYIRGVQQTDSGWVKQ